MIPFSSKFVYNNSSRSPLTTSFTYSIKNEQNKINDYIDGLLAIHQAVYKIIMTEKNKFDIYDKDFGIQLSDLFGKSIYYAESELPIRIQEALLKDDRILSVFDFSFLHLKEKGSLLTSFFISTIFGDTSFDLEVNI